MKHLLAWLASAIFLYQPACGPDDTNWAISLTQQTILNGKPDHQHPAVLLLLSDSTFCSGTLIDPRWVLSAAHCLEENIEEILIGERILIDGQVSQPAVRIPVSDVIPHPNYDPESYQNDIALIRLSTPAPSDIQPMNILPSDQRITQTDLNRSVQIVGYGPELFDPQALGGIRLEGSRPIWLVCEEHAGCERELLGMTWNIANNSICFEINEGSPTPGDSGGPVLLTRDGNEYIAGITSWMGSVESQPAGELVNLFTCATKVDRYPSFVKDVIEGNTGCRCSSRSTSPFPKNISLSILMVVVFGLWGQRKRANSRKPITG